MSDEAANSFKENAGCVSYFSTMHKAALVAPFTLRPTNRKTWNYVALQITARFPQTPCNCPTVRLPALEKNKSYMERKCFSFD